MPVKIKHRTTTGKTNGSSSKPNSKPNSASNLSATVSDAVSKPKECMCKICNCGRHRCTGSNHSNVVSVGGGPHAHMTSETESRVQYKSHEMPERKLVKLKVELPPNRPLEGISETRSQFIERPLPKRPAPHENKYVKNPAKLEGESESHEKYKAWAVGPPPVKFKTNEHKSTQEDRDFTSTTISDYVPHPKSAIHVPIKRKQVYVPNVNKFEGISTQNSDYVQFDLVAVRADNPNATPDAMKRAARVDRGGTFTITNAKDKFTAKSEYVDIFQYRPGDPTSRVGKRISPRQYEPNPNKFEGTSTQQDDYQEPSYVSDMGIKVYERVKSFKPAELIRESGAVKLNKEDREFVTETKSGFIPKQLQKCPVAERGIRPSKADDGHFYYSEDSVQQVTQAAAELVVA